MAESRIGDLVREVDYRRHRIKQVVTATEPAVKTTWKAYGYALPQQGASFSYLQMAKLHIDAAISTARRPAKAQSAG